MGLVHSDDQIASSKIIDLQVLATGERFVRSSLAFIGAHSYNAFMIYAHVNYRHFLKAEIADSAAKNPSFSMRAFAKKIGVASSTLAEVLSGKKNISSEKAMMIAEKLGLSDTETSYFILMIQFETAKSENMRASIQEKLNIINPAKKSHDLSVDQFKTISDWYHFPILELAEIPGFQLTAENISKKLGIKKIEAEVALSRLERLDLLTKNKKGELKKTKEQTITKSAIPNEALRSFHQQMLQKAITSLETQTPQEKFIATRTFAVDSKQLSKLADASREYLQKILTIADESKKKNHVYHVSTQIFRITHE